MISLSRTTIIPGQFSSFGGRGGTGGVVLEKVVATTIAQVIGLVAEVLLNKLVKLT